MQQQVMDLGLGDVHGPRKPVQPRAWDGKFAPRDPLEVAREKLLAEAACAEGAHCPVCGQYAKVYKRSLNATMARFLIWLVCEHERGWAWRDFHDAPVMQSRPGGGDWGKLLHWGMIQNAPTVSRTVKTSALYRPTALGVEFVHGRANVAAHVFLYDNKPMGWATETVTIHEALGKDFDYAALMRGEG